MEKEKQDFLLQLEQYASHGIAILLEGYVSTPEEIASTCLLKEDSVYMCDFVFSESDQRLQELHFDKLYITDDRI